MVDSGCWNDKPIHVLDLSRYSQLKEIEVGSQCFDGITEVKLIGMKELQRVVIGNMSFCSKYRRITGSFQLKYCERLRELKIGCSSFFSYATCEIENLSSLEVIEMGSLGCVGGVFQDASLVLRSIGCLCHLMNRLASVEVSSHRQERLPILSSCCV